MDNFSIGIRLINLRKVNGYTQWDVAEILNISRSTLSKYEKGIITPNVENLIKLADLYKVSCDYILCRK
ncbi:helix-turn-helix domain-containing protein [Clostridium sp.]|uniref:helix-turn-helix domain-containing protein n=1 Tax=Clostridium sp. TaxID=1506 RepID=UPI0039965325